MTERRKFMPGDVVQLRGGGPSMTVAYETRASTVLVSWVTSVGLPQQATYFPEQLKLLDGFNGDREQR